VLAVVCCGIYPLVVFGIGPGLFRDKANGSLIVDAKDGVVRGSRLIGQQFTADKYFHPAPRRRQRLRSHQFRRQQPWPHLAKAARHHRAKRADYRTQNGLATNAPVPADAVTASASGLDPHISLENAELQAPRVAKARGLKEEEVRALIPNTPTRRTLAFLGDPASTSCA
jgi:potassium-transporting ATPase KdpC subunit